VANCHCHRFYHPSDNGFLMLPKEKVSVMFISPEKFDVKTLESSLTIR